MHAHVAPSTRPVVGGRAYDHDVHIAGFAGRCGDGASRNRTGDLLLAKRVGMGRLMQRNRHWNAEFRLSGRSRLAGESGPIRGVPSTYWALAPNKLAPRSSAKDGTHARKQHRDHLCACRVAQSASATRRMRSGPSDHPQGEKRTFCVRAPHYSRRCSAARVSSHVR